MARCADTHSGTTGRPTIMTDKLYHNHIAHLIDVHQSVMAETGYDGLMVGAGAQQYRFMDDMPIPFRANPYFLWWVPLQNHPASWVRFVPGARPTVIYYQPEDYWHVPPADPEGEWTEQCDIEIIRSPEEVLQHFPKGKTAVLVDADSIRHALPGDVNPETLVMPLNWERASKTAYEITCMREANRLGAIAHRSAEQAFRNGASEFAIQQAYLAAIDASDLDMPYGNIVALNQHGAILHYDHYEHQPPAQSQAFLIDAGASHHGYASDITRTYAAQSGAFADLISAVDGVQQRLASQVMPGVNYTELHIDAHHQLMGVLREVGVLKTSPESAVESGVSATFFPHGLGHLIGLQVHDIGGHQAGPEGGVCAPPDGHPFLRLTRALQVNAAVTIEPGLYFIDMLLAELQQSSHKDMVDWAKIASLKPFGGVRIEDDVVAAPDGAVNLTRDAFAQMS